MDKQATLGFVLIGIVLVVWLYFNSPEPVPQDLPKTNDTTFVKDDSVQEQNTPSNIQELAKQVQSDNQVSSDSIPNAESRIITIETDRAKIEVNTLGARIRKVYLKNYKTWYYREIEDSTDFYDKHVQLVNPENGGDLNIIFVTKDGRLVNTESLGFDVNLDQPYYKVNSDDSLKVVFTNQFAEGKSIVKSFVFYGEDYQSKIDIELNNLDDIISSFRYDVVWSNGINFVEHNSVDEANYSNASAFSGDEQVIVDASSVGENITKDINGKVDWIGVRNKYFAFILAPENPHDEGGAYFEGYRKEIPNIGTREYYSASLKVPFNNQKYQKNTFYLYAGPVQYDTLKAYNNNYEALYDFGSLFGLKFLIRPISEYILLPLFTFLHEFIPNYGFVIVVFTLILKFVLYPLTKTSYKSMKKMQLLQPKIKEIKEKYKEDPQKVQKETMKLYSTYGINPMGGCLPMLLQMPILFALFSLFNVAIEIRHEPFILWITNLSAPDVIYTLPFKIPFFNVNQVSGLALLLGITMFFQQKMSIKDPSQKALVYVMPIMLTLLFMTFPSGLNLYYFMFNLFSIIQQYYINHSKADGELVPVANPDKKKGFMAKMMEAAEKQAQAQKQQPKKKRKF